MCHSLTAIGLRIAPRRCRLHVLCLQPTAPVPAQTCCWVAGAPADVHRPQRASMMIMCGLDVRLHKQGHGTAPIGSATRGPDQRTHIKCRGRTNLQAPASIAVGAQTRHCARAHWTSSSVARHIRHLFHLRPYCMLRRLASGYIWLCSLPCDGVRVQHHSTVTEYPGS
jgi:hypothetical protein